MERTEDYLQRYLVDGYLPTIGIECHVQLKTKTKLFTAIANINDVNQKPNSAVGPLCLGLPGTLPVVNDRAVDLAILAGLALEAEIATLTKFDRKHYFYPDLPLGYQISQHYRPIVLAGELEISISEDESFKVRIQRAHLEADAGKLTHRPGEDNSLVDLNRVGSPLLEIVSQPDMHSPAQAKRYAKELYLRMIYAGVCEGDLFAGNLRFDVNVSVSDDFRKLGTRTETKNLNSFRFIEQAVVYEIERQTKVLKSGQKIVQETRGWDESKRQTFPQRSKEDAQDYRYMPDPDIPPLKIDRSRIDELKKKLPITPRQILSLLKSWQIPYRASEVILDYPRAAEFLLNAEEGLSPQEAKLVVNWLSGDILALIKIREIDWDDVLQSAGTLQALARLKNQAKISSATVKEWLPQILIEKADPQILLKETGQIQISDEATLKNLILEVFAKHPKAVADAKADRKAAGFLIGQVMKSSRGSADPKLVAGLVDKLLNE